MINHKNRTRIAPKTMTKDEQADLISITGQDPKYFRDHVLFVLAIGTGLRQHELVALNVGDIYKRNGQVRKRVQLKVFKRSGPPAPYQEIMLSGQLRSVLEQFRQWKRERREDLKGSAPLFMSRLKSRLATRTVRHLFRVWQERAEFDRHHTFHALRHSAAMNHYRLKGDIRLTQRFMRHKNLNTTMIYTLPTDEELSESIENMIVPGIGKMTRAA